MEALTAVHCAAAAAMCREREADAHLEKFETLHGKGVRAPLLQCKAPAASFGVIYLSKVGQARLHVCCAISVKAAGALCGWEVSGQL